MGFRVTKVLLIAAAVLVAACHQEERNRFLGVPDLRIDVVISGLVTDRSGGPIADVTVSAVGRTLTRTSTGADGRYSFSVESAPRENVIVSAIREGYMAASQGVTTTGPSVEINLTLMPAWTSLPIDGSVTSMIDPADPAAWIGDAYDSDYAFNIRHFTFLTGNEPIDVELTWERTGNAALRLWLFGGASSSSPDGQSIRLPANTNGVLLVGQIGARLSQPAAFTLTTRKGGG